MPLSRRQFLKLSGLGLAAKFFPLPPEEAPPVISALARATKTIAIYDRPSWKASIVGWLRGDTVSNLYGSALSAEESYNRVWHVVRRGYVYSGQMQLVEWRPQTPLAELPAGGFLGEISVPLASARAWYTAQAREVYRLYYGTTYWFGALQRDDAGATWYRVDDERTGEFYWVPAEQVRPVTAEELAPISPQVSDKRIEVDLAKQTFRCYENGQIVLDTLCSTGIYLRTENNRRIYGTPAGDWSITRKRPTRHMAGDDAASTDFFDLPGVPWVSYFHWWGTAVHGTYWHSDFGAPHSHGCLNLPSEIAKWVFRWTTPHATTLKDQTFATENNGTPLIVL